MYEEKKLQLLWSVGQLIILVTIFTYNTRLAFILLGATLMFNARKKNSN